MTRYFLNVRDRSGVTEDQEGLDLPDPESARQEGLAMAREMLEEQTLRGAPADWKTVEVCDETGEVLASVSCGEAAQSS